MSKPRILIPPLALAGALFLMLSAPLVAAPACERAEIPTKALNAEGGQAIDTTAELSSALKSAKGGEVFVLAPGNYGKLSLAKSFDDPVTIRSANPDHPACFTGMALKATRNLVLDRLYFDYVFEKGDKHFIFPFAVLKGGNIKITNSVFDGDFARDTNSGADGYSFGLGLRIIESNDFVLSGNEFRKWWTGILTLRSARLTISGNDIHTIRSDGIDLDAVTDLLIEKNYIHDFGGAAGSKDHRDMIQIMRVTPSGSADIVIRDNIFDMGGGQFTQTIWAGGDGKNLRNPTMRHRNIWIENNVIYNAHVHGISVHGTDNISIRKNTLIHVPGGHSAPAINISSGSTSVVIEQNVTSDIIGHKNQRDWAVLNNAMIQDKNPATKGYYDSQFIYYALGQKRGYNEYGVRSGSLIDHLNAGSTLVKKYPTR